MRNISVELKAHLAGDTTSLATLWRCVLTNGTILNFTDHDTDITYLGEVYLASSGFLSSTVETTSAMNVDNLELTGVLTSPAITEADLITGRWDFADITLTMVNYKDLTMGGMILRKGTIGQVATERSKFHAELRGMLQPLQQGIMEMYSSSCRAKLGDARCGKNLASFTFAGSVTTASTQKSWFDTALTQTNSTHQVAITNITQAAPAVVTSPAHGFTSGQNVAISQVLGMVEINGKQAAVSYIDANNFSIAIDTSVATGLYSPYISGGIATLAPASEYFQNGLVTWLTGANAGLSAEIKLYYTGFVELFQSAPYPINQGDTYTIYAGCDKQILTCKDRFANVINFRGEPHIPGTDQLIAHA